jgi:uncharacterized membrane protein SpoIIM required for sporulation
MLKNPIIRAWKWLFVHLVIAASLSYFTSVVIALSGLAKPESILMATTLGIRHIGSPIMWQGVAFGIDKGIMIFFCNMTVVLLILSIICWVRLLNPYNTNNSFARLRKELQKDRTAKHLRFIPYFARIKSYQLRLSAFILLCIPFIAVVFLGIMIGTLLGSLHMASTSSLVAFAFIIPHGIPEIAGVLLACSIPVAIWMTIQPTIINENPSEAFRRINRFATSKTLQQNLKMIINLLLIAGLIEAHMTFRIVSLLTKG